MIVCVPGSTVISVNSRTVGVGGAELTVNCPMPTITDPLTGAVAVAVIVVAQELARQLPAVANPEFASTVATLELVELHCTLVTSAVVGLAV